MNEQREYEELVTMNLGLVGLIVNGVTNDIQEKDDLFQIGAIGLMKAANSFDEKRDVKFSSYAAECIRNEIFMEFRKKGVKARKANIVSFDSPIKNNNGEKKLVVGDLIADPKQNFEEQNELNYLLEHVLNYIINILNSRERYVILCRAGGIIQEKLANELEISQSFISRVEKRAEKKLNIVLRSNVKTEGRYRIEVKNGEICFTFDGNKKILHEILEKIDFELYVKKIIVEYYEKGITIKVPADEESLPFIAKIIEKLEKK